MSAEAIDLLRSIDGSLKALLALVQPLVTQVRAAQPKPVATDKDLDGKYGDPMLKFMPRDWTGPTYKNRKYSECPPELLDLVAQSNDWFAEQADKKYERTNGGNPVGDYRRADAARARGWAKRMREGRHVAPINGHAHPDGWPEEGAASWG